MRLRGIARLCLPLAAAAGIFIAGCAAPGRARLPICPGKASVEDALATLAAHAQQAAPFKANGQILLNYHEPDSGKRKRHNIPMQLWFNPPREFYVQGTIAVDPKAVIIGSNDERFWLALRPPDVSTYYIGDWSEVRSVEGLMMSPRVVLEAFGIIVDGEPNAAGWSLKNEGAFDILTKRNEAGRLVERVHIYACDYLIRKIEFFDQNQKAAAVAQLGNYRPLTDRFQVPTRVLVTTTGPSRRTDSIDITLTSTKGMEFKEQVRKLIFNPPKSEGFKHAYTLMDGKWVRQR